MQHTYPISIGGYSVDVDKDGVGMLHVDFMVYPENQEHVYLDFLKAIDSYCFEKVFQQPLK